MCDHFCRNKRIALYTEQNYHLYQNKVHLPAFGTKIAPQVLIFMMQALIPVSSETNLIVIRKNLNIFMSKKIK